MNVHFRGQPLKGRLSPALVSGRRRRLQSRDGRLQILVVCPYVLYPLRYLGQDKRIVLA